MLGTLNALVASTLLFVVGHFVLSGQPLRNALVQRLGTAAFRGVYAALIAAAMLWMILAYGRAPVVDVWHPTAVMAMIPVALMPLAMVLIVTGIAGPSPTAVGGENLLTDSPGGVSGIHTVTRHPFLWGTTLWAASHLCANGDAANIIMLSGILLLSLGGMWHIDRRREAQVGAAWGPFRLTTSVIPFAAALSGRVRVDWRGIGLLRPAAGLALYVAALAFHEIITGVPLTII